MFADINEHSRYPGVTHTPIQKAFDATGKKMLLLFDYGDEWRFIVRLHRIVEREKATDYPSVLEGQGKLRQY